MKFYRLKRLVRALSAPFADLSPTDTRTAALHELIAKAPRLSRGRRSTETRTDILDRLKDSIEAAKAAKPKPKRRARKRPA